MKISYIQTILKMTIKMTLIHVHANYFAGHVCMIYFYSLFLHNVNGLLYFYKMLIKNKYIIHHMCKPQCHM